MRTKKNNSRLIEVIINTTFMPWFAASSVLFFYGPKKVTAVECYSQSIVRTHNLCYLVFTVPDNICIVFVNP